MVSRRRRELRSGLETKIIALRGCLAWCYSWVLRMELVEELKIAGGGALGIFKVRREAAAGIPVDELRVHRHGKSTITLMAYGFSSEQP